MIKWTVKDCIEHIQQLKNPFEKTAGVVQKPKLSEAIKAMEGKGNGSKEKVAQVSP